MVKTTIRNEVQPGKVSVIESVQKAMSSVGSGMAEVMAHPWRLMEDCSKHVQLAATGNARSPSVW